MQLPSSRLPHQLLMQVESNNRWLFESRLLQVGSNSRWLLEERRLLKVGSNSRWLLEERRLVQVGSNQWLLGGRWATDFTIAHLHLGPPTT